MRFPLGVPGGQRRNKNSRGRILDRRALDQRASERRFAPSLEILEPRWVLAASTWESLYDAAELAGREYSSDRISLGFETPATLPTSEAAQQYLAAVAVRAGAGVGGADRVTVVWPDGAIVNQWLRVEVLATPNTGLAAADVHYWGNAIGETGNLVGDAVPDARVDFADRIAVLRNLAAGPVDATNVWDINRDRVVDATDAAIVAAHATGLAGDFNRDDRVGVADLARLQSRISSATANPYDGDLNGDGVVNRADVALLALEFGGSTTSAMLAN